MISSSSSSQQHIRIIRLPLHIFHNLTEISITTSNNQDIDDNDSSSKVLRGMIVTKLQHYASSSGNSSNTDSKSSLSASKNKNKNTNNKSISITVGFVIHIPLISLLHILDPLLTYNECKEFYRRLCYYCSPTKQTAIELFYNFHEKSKSGQQQHTNNTTFAVISTGIVSFDKYLHGGIRIGTITEIYGPPGCGKTQLAIQISIQLAINNTNTCNNNTSSYGTMYIDTENKLCIKRMKEICINRIKIKSSQQQQIQNNNNNTSDSSNSSINKNIQSETTTTSTVLSKISIHTPHTLHDLWYVLVSLEDDLLLGSAAAAAVVANNQNNNDNNNTSSVPFGGSCIDPTTNEQQQQFQEEQNGSNTNLPHPTPLPSLPLPSPIRLIVIDSIAAPMNRLDDINIDKNNNNNSKSISSLERSTMLLKIAQLLKRYADQFQLAVLIINQIVTSSNNDQNNSNNNNTILDHNNDDNDNNNNSTVDKYGQQQQQQQRYVAALGISWHHCVSTRIQVYWMDDCNNNDKKNNSENTQLDATVAYSNNQYHHHHNKQRLLSIVKSNVVPCTSSTSGNSNNPPIPFIIDAQGCVGIGS